MSNILETKTYKNYRQLCEAMDWKFTKGKGRAYQFKELDTLCKYHKDGNKIVIDEIFNIAKEKVDGRKDNKGNGKAKSEFIKQLEENIMYLVFLNGEDRHHILTKNLLATLCGLVNNNYSYVKQHRKLYAKENNLNLHCVNDNLDKINSMINDNLDRALKSLSSQRLIMYKSTKVLTFENGNSRVADDTELNFILDYERETLNELEYKNINEVYKSNNTEYFYKRVISKLNKDDMINLENLQYYISAYDISYTPKHTENYLVNECNMNRDRLKEVLDTKKQQLNDKCIDKSIKNAKSRVTKAKKQQFRLEGMSYFGKYGGIDDVITDDYDMPTDLYYNEKCEVSRILKDYLYVNETLTDDIINDDSNIIVLVDKTPTESYIKPIIDNEVNDTPIPHLIEDGVELPF